MQQLTVEALEALTLTVGSHSSRTDGVCAMEAVAWLAGEPHSDHPKCVSPCIGAFLRKWNDVTDEAGRQILKPYLPKVVGTVGKQSDETRRAWMLTDWLVRVHAPTWLDLAGLTEPTQSLRSLPEITSASLAKAAQPTINEARTNSAAAARVARAAALAASGVAGAAAAWAAAADASCYAARAARDAAWDAEAAARAAAWAAEAAARDAAAIVASCYAAWDATGRKSYGRGYQAAYAVAQEKLKPTEVSLQASALELLDRLITVTSGA